MEKRYQIQYLTKTSGQDIWVDRIGAEWPFTEEGLNTAIRETRYLHKHYRLEHLQFRLVTIKTEPMDIHL